MEGETVMNAAEAAMAGIFGSKGSGGGSGLSLKTVSWTGTGTATNNITFSEKPTLVLSIQMTNKDPLNAACMPFRYGSPSMFCVYSDTRAPSTWRGTYTSRLTYSADELTMTITRNDKGSAWNDETTNYTLYYM